MTINVELLRKVVDQMRSEPDRWTQKDWGRACDTAHCFGGWVLVLGGKAAVLDEPETEPLVEGVAQLLGLHYEQADDLCYTGMGDTLERYIERLTEYTGVSFEEDV